MNEYQEVRHFLFLIHFIESSVHNEVTHHCNRLRLDGYKDKTWEYRINKEFV